MKEVLYGGGLFVGRDKPLSLRYELSIRPAGMSTDEHMRVLNELSAWVIRCVTTNEEFTANGFELELLNAMQVIAAASQYKENEETGDH